MEMDLQKSKRAVFISTFFPNHKEPEYGVHVFQRAQGLSKLCHLEVIAPLPWFPGFRAFKIFKNWHKFSQIAKFETYKGISVYHPRYIMIPKVSGPLLGLLIFFAIFGLLRELKRKGQAQVVNAQFVYPCGVSTALAARLLKIPVVLSAMGSDINLYKRFLLRRVQIKWALNCAQSVTAVTDALKEEIVKLEIAPSKIKTIPNGVDASRFFVKPRNEARDLLGLDKDFKLILFVGSFDNLLGTPNTIKGSEYLIEAVSILRKEYAYNFKLVLIGEGPLKRVIQQKAKELGVGDIVSFLGSKPYKEIPLWMNACDVFVRPSLIDGMPNVVLEALACGRPVVASRVGGLPSMINSKNGILVKPRDPQGIAQALKQTLKQKWDDNEIVSTVKGLSWEECARGYLEQMQRVI